MGRKDRLTRERQTSRPPPLPSLPSPQPTRGQAATRSLHDAIDQDDLTRLLGNTKVKGAVQSGDPDQLVSAIMDLLQTINGRATSAETCRRISEPTRRTWRLTVAVISWSAPRWGILLNVNEIAGMENLTEDQEKKLVCQF
jgi:hypothetical protein